MIRFFAAGAIALSVLLSPPADAKPELNPFKKNKCLRIVPLSGLNVTLPGKIETTVKVWDECDHMFDGLLNREGWDPVTRLKARNFFISEDDDTSSSYEASANLTVTPARIKNYTLLLLDLSKSVWVKRDSWQQRRLRRAAKFFAKRVLNMDSARTSLAIYAFDGRANISPVIEYTDDLASIERAIDEKIQCPGELCQDDSTNLNGAIVQGVQSLNEILASSPVEPNEDPILSLVVFTDGTDRAGRVSDTERQNVLGQFTQSGNRRVYAIGVGKEVDRSTLEQIGSTEWVMSTWAFGAVNAFSKITRAVEKDANSTYKISYCSPARSGDHSLNLKISRHPLWNQWGAVSLGGFSAEGFEGGCTP